MTEFLAEIWKVWFRVVWSDESQWNTSCMAMLQSERNIIINASATTVKHGGSVSLCLDELFEVG